MDLILEGGRIYAIENKLRTLCSIAHYLVWSLFDCNKEERKNIIYAGACADDWDEEDGRIDETSDEEVAGGRTILTYASGIGEKNSDLGSPFAFRMG